MITDIKKQKDIINDLENLRENTYQLKLLFKNFKSENNLLSLLSQKLNLVNKQIVQWIYKLKEKIEDLRETGLIEIGFNRELETQIDLDNLFQSVYNSVRILVDTIYGVNMYMYDLSLKNNINPKDLVNIRLYLNYSTRYLDIIRRTNQKLNIKGNEFMKKKSQIFQGQQSRNRLYIRENLILTKNYRPKHLYELDIVERRNNNVKEREFDKLENAMTELNVKINKIIGKGEKLKDRVSPPQQSVRKGESYEDYLLTYSFKFDRISNDFFGLISEISYYTHDYLCCKTLNKEFEKIGKEKNGFNMTKFLEEKHGVKVILIPKYGKNVNNIIKYNDSEAYNFERFIKLLFNYELNKKLIRVSVDTYWPGKQKWELRKPRRKKKFFQGGNNIDNYDKQRYLKNEIERINKLINKPKRPNPGLGYTKIIFPLTIEERTKESEIDNKQMCDRSITRKPKYFVLIAQLSKDKYQLITTQYGKYFFENFSDIPQCEQLYNYINDHCPENMSTEYDIGTKMTIYDKFLEKKKEINDIYLSHLNTS